MGNLKYLVEKRWTLDNVQHMMNELKTLGEEARDYIKDRVHNEHIASAHQFVAACVLSRREIERMSEDAFDDAREFLDTGRAICPRAYLSFERVAVLMNDPDTQDHGEARLLDPYREILEDILPDTSEMAEENMREDLMEKMEDNLFEAKGPNTKPIILLYSYYIPCTEHDFMCSELIKNYVQRTGAQMIVSYDHLYEDTYTDEALSLLDDKRIYVLEPEEEEELDFVSDRFGYLGLY